MKAYLKSMLREYCNQIYLEVAFEWMGFHLWMNLEEQSIEVDL